MRMPVNSASSEPMTKFEEAPAEKPRAIRLRAFSVHLLTALGAGIALMALLEAVRGHWQAMFGWLGLALLVDGIDGPLARQLDVKRTLPHWSGDTLDLVVDFTTYVFVPAFAIMTCGLLVPHVAPLVGIAIVMSGALYFADLRMKLDDNRFRGFPTLWNVAVFYLLLLRPSPWVATFGMIGLVIATFLPIPFMHPIRVVRWRRLNVGILLIGLALAVIAVLQDFTVSPAITAGLVLIAAYVMLVDPAIQIALNNRRKM